MAGPADIHHDGVRSQARWLLLFFLVAMGACLLTDIAANNRTLERWITAKSSALSEKNGKLFSNNGSFIDYEERVFLDEIPHTDFTQGRLYFFGSSNMKWAFTTWDLPENLRRHLGNYGTGGAANQTVLRLVRFVGDKGMFASGAKSEVIIGVSYHLGTTETSGSYFPSLVRRQGLYAITPDDLIVETPIPPIQRWLRIEKARCGGFIRNVGRLVYNWVLTAFGLSHQPPHNPAEYRAYWREFMGSPWQENVQRELGRLDETLTLLKEHGVPAKVILLPQGTWMGGLPYGPFYNQRVRALAQLKSIPLLDWSSAIPDADFIDSNHLTVTGQTKFRSMILKEEAGRLHRLAKK